MRLKSQALGLKSQDHGRLAAAGTRQRQGFRERRFKGEAEEDRGSKKMEPGSGEVGSSRPERVPEAILGPI